MGALLPGQLITIYGDSDGLPAGRIMDGFTDDVVTMDARYAWKYAASRTMTGTPQFLVNGVPVPTAPNFFASDWDQFITTLLNTPV